MTLEVTGRAPAGTTPAIATPDGGGQGVGDQEGALGTDGLGRHVVRHDRVNRALGLPVRDGIGVGIGAVEPGGGQHAAITAGGGRIGLIQGGAKAVGHFGDEVRRHLEAAIGQHGVAAHHFQRGELGGPQGQGFVGGDVLAGEAEAGQAIDIGIQPDGAHQPDRHHVLGLGEAKAQCGRAFIDGRRVLGLPHGALGGIPLVDRGVVDEGCQGITLLQRGGIEEGLDVGADLATSLIDPVELGDLEAEATNQGLDGTVLRVHGDQGGVDVRDLGEQQLFPFLPHPDLGADLQYVPCRFRWIGLAIIGDESSGPLDTVPAEFCLLAILQHQGGALVADLGDHGGHQGLVGRLLGQVGHDLIVVPGRFPGLPQQGGRAAIAVAGVIVEDAVQ